LKSRMSLRWFMWSLVRPMMVEDGDEWAWKEEKEEEKKEEKEEA